MKSPSSRPSTILAGESGSPGRPAPCTVQTRYKHTKWFTPINDELTIASNAHWRARGSQGHGQPMGEGCGENKVLQPVLAAEHTQARTTKIPSTPGARSACTELWLDITTDAPRFLMYVVYAASGVKPLSSGPYANNTNTMQCDGCAYTCARAGMRVCGWVDLRRAQRHSWLCQADASQQQLIAITNPEIAIRLVHRHRSARRHFDQTSVCAIGHRGC